MSKEGNATNIYIYIRVESSIFDRETHRVEVTVVFLGFFLLCFLVKKYGFLVGTDGVCL